MTDNAGHTLAVFDFDGTITRTDTFPMFLRHSRSRARFVHDSIASIPTLCLLLAGRIPRQEAKRRILDIFFHGWSREEIRRAGSRFAARALPRVVRPRALERIRSHQRSGHQVLVVTASVDEWVAPWCRSQGVELLATRLEYDAHGTFTGHLATRNCRGDEKVERIMRAVGEPRERMYVYAYGDSAGDKPMLQWADESRYKPFRGRP